MARLFVSYARADVDIVTALVAELRELGHEPFYDQDVSGGQRWWDVLLDRIASSAAFLPVLSERYADSEACGLEAAWAHSLGVPIVPIDLGSLRPELCDPYIAEANWVRYSLDDRQSITRLARSLSELREWTAPATEPTRPPVPITYLAATRQELRDPAAMPSERQFAILAALRAKLETDEDGSARSLLTELRGRADVTYSVAVEIDTLFARRPKRPPAGPNVGVASSLRARRRQRVGLISAIALGVVIVLVLGIIWLVARNGSTPRSTAGQKVSGSTAAKSTPSMPGPTSASMSTSRSMSDSMSMTSTSTAPMVPPTGLGATLPQALQNLDRDTHLVKWSSCHQMHDANEVMCTNPDSPAAEWADFRVYPTLHALYDAYVARVRTEHGSFRENHLNCWKSVWSGEASWDHNGSHSHRYTVAQMRRGAHLDEDTQAAGRVFCGSQQAVQHIIWTQNAGHLLAEVWGTPAPETFAWWHTVHHYIGALRMSMH